ncbi:MAG: XTP/dITP diphosphatase [Elusimicrobiota bacterium]
MIKIFLATGNKNKIKEISAILPENKFKVETFSDRPDMPQTVEDGNTLRENSEKKAFACARYFKMPALADDTGLEVEFLGGAPGVYSARWAGEGCSYDDNNLKMLKEMNGVPKEKRKARFVCCITLAYPDGTLFSFEGSTEGYISEEKLGKEGFGYDPLFYIPEYGLTYAQMPQELKNKISHRAKALNLFARHVEKYGI